MDSDTRIDSEDHEPGGVMDEGERINRLLQRVTAIGDELVAIHHTCDQVAGSNRPAELKRAMLEDLRDQARALRCHYDELMETVEMIHDASLMPDENVRQLIIDWKQHREANRAEG